MSNDIDQEVVADDVEEPVAEKGDADEAGTPSDEFQALIDDIASTFNSMCGPDYIPNLKTAATSFNEVTREEAANRGYFKDDPDTENPFTFEERLQMQSLKTQSMGMADIVKQLSEIDGSIMLRVKQEERLYDEREELNADQHMIAMQLEDLNETLNVMTEGQDKVVLALRDIWAATQSISRQ